MPTAPEFPEDLPASPSIPLTPELLAAYQNLYSKYEGAIDNTADPKLEESLLASQSQVEAILDQDADYRLKANTERYNKLLKQIDDANADLQKLKSRILKTSTDINVFGGILSAITGVLTLV